MKIIKIFSSFATSECCIEVYTRIHELFKDEEYNKTYKFTTNNNFTHAIILNVAMPKLTIPKENVIGLAFEPPYYLGLTKDFLNYAEKHISKYYIGENYDIKLPKCFILHHGYIWHITPLIYIPIKNKIMSIMVSFKKLAPGHQYRHELVKYILENNLPIDIYGNGCIFYNNHSTKYNNQRLKGEFKEKEPYENYYFHIAIENFQTQHYFSEKITNTLLCNTTPIYLGCINIDNYFENVIKLTGNLKHDLNLIYNICKNPDNYKKNHNIEKIKSVLSIKNVINEF